jgi:peptidoglycan/LPS O-acetylase OafA/YrhL
MTPGIEPLHWIGLLTHLTFTFGAITKTTLSTMLPDWSISLEMQFYLALPFIMLLYRRAGHIVSTVLLVAAWVIANHLFSFGHDMAARPFGHFPMPSFLPLKLNCFAIGILLAESLYFKNSDARRSWLLCLLALGVACTLDKYVILLASFSALMLLYSGDSAPAPVRNGLAWIRSIFGSRPCVFLADTSYGVYLFHLLALWPMAAWFAQHQAFRRLPGVERFAICLSILLLVAYPVAWAMHKFVEQPGIALGKRFIRRNKPLVRPETIPIPQVEIPEAAALSQ